MTRLFFLLVIGALGWYAYTNGIVYLIMHEGQPEPGRECEVVGPVKDGVGMMFNKSDTKYLYDTRFGTAAQKMEARVNLDAIMRAGGGMKLDDHQKVRVLDSGKIRLYDVDYMVVKVQTTGGADEGTIGWVEREDLMDTPLQLIYQGMRGTSMPERRGSSGS